MLKTSIRCVSKKFDFDKMSDGTSNIYETCTHSGEDAWFIGKNIIGVADGVSGWKTKGVSSAFSSSLMSESDYYSKLNPNSSPIEILEKAYTATQNNVVGGSSTACIAKFNGSSLNVANLGDSGVIIIRNNQDFVFQTSFDYINANCPCQLGKWELNEDSNDPKKHRCDVFDLYNQKGRRVTDAKLYDFQVMDQDIIIMATDGFFDNIYRMDIIQACSYGNDDGKNINDPDKISLFLIKKAIKNTLSMNPNCIDDITIIVGVVNNHDMCNHISDETIKNYHIDGENISVYNPDFNHNDDQCECNYCSKQSNRKRQRTDS